MEKNKVILKIMCFSEDKPRIHKRLKLFWNPIQTIGQLLTHIRTKNKIKSTKSFLILYQDSAVEFTLLDPNKPLSSYTYKEKTLRLVNSNNKNDLISIIIEKEQETFCLESIHIASTFGFLRSLLKEKNPLLDKIVFFGYDNGISLVYYSGMEDITLHDLIFENETVDPEDVEEIFLILHCDKEGEATIVYENPPVEGLDYRRSYTTAAHQNEITHGPPMSIMSDTMQNIRKPALIRETSFVPLQRIQEPNEREPHSLMANYMVNPSRTAPEIIREERPRQNPNFSPQEMYYQNSREQGTRLDTQLRG